MSASYKISIALVTRNRPDSLRRCLKSWRAQTVQPFEIVISDDSDDATRPMVQKIAEEFDAQWVAGPRRGLYANRNHVARNCQGTHVFSADDDHEHLPDFLEKCCIALLEDPDSCWCIGEIHSWEQLGQAWGLPGQLSFNGTPVVIVDSPNSWAWSDGASICPKRLFEMGLYFCDSFRFGASYLEFGCLLHAIGQKIRILDSTGVIHHVREVGRSFQIPIEEAASRYFALLMLGLAYQPSNKHLVFLMYYFLKQMIRNPILFIKAFPWAWKEYQKRSEWFSNLDLALLP